MGFNKTNNFDDAANSQEKYTPTASHMDVYVEAGRHLLLSSFGHMADSVAELKVQMQRQNAVAMASTGISRGYHPADDAAYADIV